MTPHNYFRSAFIEVRKKTTENVASDGFWLNFNGAAFCLTQPIGGLLVKASVGVPQRRLGVTGFDWLIETIQLLLIGVQESKLCGNQ